VAGEKQNNVWPLLKFYFRVKFENMEAYFQEVSGLDVEAQTIEYRNGNNNNLPGIKKCWNVTLKKGIFVKDNSFWDWCNQINMKTIEKENVVISLLDESGKPKMVWTLKNAWPTKILGTDMKSDGNEVAVETIEIAHEGLKIENK